MKLSPSLRKKLLPVGAVLAPVVMLHLIHTGLSSGPASATATNYVPPTALPELPKAAAPKASLDQEKAIAWLKDPTRQFTGKSPMEHSAPPEIVVKEPEVVISATPSVSPTNPAAEVLPIPQVSITTILSRSAEAGGSIAVMSGRAYKLGDTVARGWTVLQIDRDDWTVTLKCEDGREVQIGSTTKRR